MTRLEMIRESADLAREIAEIAVGERASRFYGFDAVGPVVEMALAPDDHPTIPDPPTWTGPCAERAA